MSPHRADSRSIYSTCTKVANTQDLSQHHPPTVWTARLGVLAACAAVEDLYKSPLRKSTGDLQWQILHGALATNSFRGLNRNTTCYSVPIP